MVIYEMTIKYAAAPAASRPKAAEEPELPFCDDTESDLPDRNKYENFTDHIAEANEYMTSSCDSDADVFCFIYDGHPGELKMIAVYRMESVSYKACSKSVLSLLSEAFPEGSEFTISSDIRECCPGRLSEVERRAGAKGHFPHHTNMLRNLKLDYYDNSQFQVKESCICPGKVPSKRSSIKHAENILADQTLLDELERIYSSANVKKYYGNPVHYALQVSSIEAANELTDVLIPALYANKRLQGSRVVQLFNIDEQCFKEEDLDNLFAAAQGNTILIDMRGSNGLHGNYASAYEDVIDDLVRLIQQYGNRVLCLFAKDTEHPGFADTLLSRAAEIIDIIEIREGAGDRSASLSYLKHLSESSDMPVNPKDLEEILPDKDVFTILELRRLYRKWYGNGLKSRAYKAYQAVSTIAASPGKVPVSEPYKELQNMVGLSEIKQTVDQIIANGKMLKLKESMGLDHSKSSMHMIFTGNPGSAKTTVARLLSKLLYKEGILDNDTFIEVGRADLIAKYVGWTAKTVKSKFRAAQGGILFIDEAYSLVDNENSFGDEAINTIVQEMENCRDDVIVIFAGYPEKMRQFLDKNEGLRSRIAFHLNFPDYNADEMLKILDLMLQKKGYRMDEEAQEKCLQIFREACTHPEFGNGRFARNFMEQAIMRQSERLFRECRGENPTADRILLLIAEDFSTSVCSGLKTERKVRIGFGA